MTILEELYDLCSSCNTETEKGDLVEGVCLWCWNREGDNER